MNLDKVQFYNVGDFEKIPGIGDHGLVRIPVTIRNQLNERARFIGMESVGVEVRFVTDAPNIDVSVSVVKPEGAGKGMLRIYKGDFSCKDIEVPSGGVHTFRLNPPMNFSNANDHMLRAGGYAPTVWRIVWNSSIGVIHGINTHGYSIRPPKPDELPSLNWLAYGSSITHSSIEGYPHFAAAKLKVQVQNKGLSGSCHIEKELVDYLLDHCSFDFITCELGINMRGQYTPEEFRKRAQYLIHRLVQLNKPALIITTFPNGQSAQYTTNQNVATEHETAYNQILIELVKEENCKTLQYIHGYEVLDDVTGLSGDLCHPNTYGHAVMGNNLAKRLQAFVGDCGINI